MVTVQEHCGSDFLWFLMNVISKYLFLEQFCQFSERVLKFFSKAGDSIHSFSSCTHIGALKTVWKCIFSWKSAYLYTSNGHVCSLPPPITLTLNMLSVTSICNQPFAGPRGVGTPASTSTSHNCDTRPHIKLSSMSRPTLATCHRSLELQTKAPEDYAKFYHHKEGPCWGHVNMNYRVCDPIVA